MRSSSSRSRYHIRKASLLGYPSSWIASAAQHSYLIYKSTARSRCCLLYVMTTPSLTQRVQKKTSPPHAEHFYLITYTRGRARRRPGAVQPKRPLAMRTQAMPATCSRSGRPASNPRPTRPGPPPAPLRRSGGDGRPAAAHAADSRFPHDVHHPAAADPGRIPALRRRPGARLAAPVHGHEGTGMGLEDAAGRRLAPGGHAAAACPVFLVKSVFRVSSLIFFGFRHEECRPVVCFTGCPSCRT